MTDSAQSAALRSVRTTSEPNRRGKRSHDDALSRVLLLVAGVLAVLLIDGVDYLTRERLHLELFYVFPVGLIAWHLGRRAALFVGVLTAVVWLATDRLADPSRTMVWVPVWNSLLRVAFFSIVAEVLVRLREALREAQYLSSRDALTQALNARAFLRAVETEVARCRRYGHPFSVAYIDIDDFKRVNDRHGHQVGDELLRRVSEVLRSQLRQVDVVARLGGDEFAVLLPETRLPAARTALDKIQGRLEASLSADLPRITLSIGLVTFEEAPRDVDEVIHRADALMYEVKRAGKASLRAEAAGS